MAETSHIDYSPLDRPEILLGLFHPRPDYEQVKKPDNAIDMLIPVEGSIAIGGSFHMADRSAPNILFFHGNGEIASDYDEIGPLYNDMRMNFLAVDYRGYGRSTGSPTVTNMMKDAYAIYEFTRGWLGENGYTGAFIVMGRSLGSAPALELANYYMEQINGLIVESGFAHTELLLELLGLDASSIGLTEEKGLRNLDKMRTWGKPALIIHAEFDHIFPFTEGRALYDASPSPEKRLLMIPKSGHNDIFMTGRGPYMDAVRMLTKKTGT